MSDFDIFKKMIDSGLDLKASTSILEVQNVKKGAIVKMGIDADTAQDLMKSMFSNDGKYVCVLYVVNMEDYKKAEKEIKSNT